MLFECRIRKIAKNAKRGSNAGGVGFDTLSFSTLLLRWCSNFSRASILVKHTGPQQLLNIPRVSSKACAHHSIRLRQQWKFNDNGYLGWMTVETCPLRSTMKYPIVNDFVKPSW